MKNAKEDITRICKLHGITPDDRLMLQFEMGCQYAEAIVSQWYLPEETVQAMAMSLRLQKIAGYWNWYSNQWLIIDRDILRAIDSGKFQTTKIPYNQLQTLYKERHLYIRAYPGADVVKSLFKKHESNSIKAN